MSNCDVDIFVGNHTLIDPDVYQLWLTGYTAQEAAAILQKRGILQQYGATFELLQGDTLDHYRTFDQLERWLQAPARLQDQPTFQITPDMQRMLIENYYEFDSIVMREIMGKKLSTRNRNNLDDVSEKVKIPLRSCRRQFDNLKQVFKVVEEMLGSLVNNIKTHFLISNYLAEQYAAIVFITNNRFETSKKKLIYLTFEDLVYCANQMMLHWSYSSKDCRNHDDMDVDFDRDFLHSLRDLKPLSDWKQLDEHKMLTLQKMKGKISGPASADIEGNFKVLHRIGKSISGTLGLSSFESLSKNLINIGSNLNHSKDMRDIFIDWFEKFIEPCRQGGWTHEDVAVFLKSYMEAGHQMDLLAKSTNLATVWQRYMAVVSACIVRMYHT